MFGNVWDRALSRVCKHFNGPVKISRRLGEMCDNDGQDGGREGTHRALFLTGVHVKTLGTSTSSGSPLEEQSLSAVSDRTLQSPFPFPSCSSRPQTQTMKTEEPSQSLE